MTDSVSSDLHDFYEELVRNSLRNVFMKAFGIYCREPEDGFCRYFQKKDDPSNQWWIEKTNDTQIEIDFLAHVSPLSSLPDINEKAISEISYVKMFKSILQTSIEGSDGIPHAFPPLKSQSPEKSDKNVDDQSDNFQYVVAEITSGGRKSAKEKLDQLEKDCFFLCSRRSRDTPNLLGTIAFVAIVSPNLDAIKACGSILNVSRNGTSYPLLRKLYFAGRFVGIQHVKTIGFTMRELMEKVDTVGAKLSEQSEASLEQSETLNTLKTQLSEQREASLEQSETLNTLNAKLDSLSELMAALLLRFGTQST